MFSKPNFWAECRRRAIKETQANHELSAPDIDLAIMSERQILTGRCAIAGCGNIKGLTGKICSSCANRCANKTCATAGCKKRSGQKTYCSSCYDLGSDSIPEVSILARYSIVLVSIACIDTHCLIYLHLLIFLS